MTADAYPPPSLGPDHALLAKALPRACRLIDTAHEKGWQIGTQLYLRFQEEVIVDLGIGEARPGVPMSRDTLMLWLSSTKPLAAVAILQRLAAGELGLDDLVTRFIPEFGRNGKEGNTLRHLLTHTGGFRWVDLGDTLDEAEIVAKICDARQERDWKPGAKAGYHPYSSWYILGEVIRRVTGLRFSDYVRREIFLPLKMDDCWVGLPTEEAARYGDRVGWLMHTDGAMLRPNRWSTPEGMPHGPPGAGGYGPMRQFARLYEALLAGGELDGNRILPKHLVDFMASPQRVDMFDQTFMHKLDMGLGVILNSNRHGAETVPYNYGRYAGVHTFGHSGNQSSAAFADPDNNLVAAIVFNGMCGEKNHQVRIREVLSAMYQDLGIV